MKMTIIEHWPADAAIDGTPIAPRVKPPVTFAGDSGWQSVKEMQDSLIRRFPQDGPQRITNGIMYTTLSYGRTMFVVLHD
jgi:hypothetical protein